MLNFGLTMGRGAAIIVIPPTNLQGSATFPPAEVILTWDAPIGSDNPIASYEVWRDDVQLGGTALLTYTDDDGALLPDTSYKYQVLAIDTKGKKSPLSTHINVAIPTLILLAAPLGVATVQTIPNHTVVTVNWDALLQGGASFDVDSYNIYRDNVLIDNVDSAILTYEDTPPMVQGAVYTYAVSGVDTAGNEGALASTTQTIYLPLISTHSMLVGVGGAGALGYIRGNFGSMTPPSIDGVDIQYLRTFTGLNSEIGMLDLNMIRVKDPLYVSYVGLAEVFTLVWDGGSNKYLHPSSQTLFDFLTANRDQVVTLTISEIAP